MKRRHQTKRLGRTRRLALEALDSRRLLAGVCTIGVGAEEVAIDCDNKSNDLEIRQIGPQTYRVASGANATKFDLGSGPIEGPVTFDVSGGRDWDVNLGNGDDQLKTVPVGRPDVAFHGHLAIHYGSGSNSIVLADGQIQNDLTITRDASASTNMDALSLVAENTRVEGNVTLRSSGGDSNVVFEDAFVGGDLIGRQGNGTSVFEASNLMAQGAVDVVYGNGRSTNLIAATEIGGKLRIKAGDGALTARLENVQVDNDLLIKDTRGDTDILISLTEVGGDATIVSRNGVDSFTMSRSVIRGSLLHKLGAGGSDVTYESSNVVGDMKLVAEGGQDVIEVTALTVNANAKIKSLDGADRIDIRFSIFFAPLIVSGGPGSDVFVESGNVYFDGLVLKGFP